MKGAKMRGAGIRLGIRELQGRWLPNEAEGGLIPIKLKRKQEYKTAEKQEHIRPGKIFEALKYLNKAGHPYYKFFINIVKCLHISDGCNVRGQLAHALLGGCHQLTKL